MKYWLHFWTIVRHRHFVFIECMKRGLIWRGLVHDLSKFSPTEFFESARYFQGDSTPINAVRKAKGYSLAWVHHKSHNNHHWEYWMDFYRNTLVPVPIPKNCLLEMVSDMIGASKAYGKGSPLDYFQNHVNEWVVGPNEKEFVRKELIEYENRSQNRQRDR